MSNSISSNNDEPSPRFLFFTTMPISKEANTAFQKTSQRIIKKLEQTIPLIFESASINDATDLADFVRERMQEVPTEKHEEEAQFLVDNSLSLAKRFYLQVPEPSIGHSGVFAGGRTAFEEEVERVMEATGIEVLVRKEMREREKREKEAKEKEMWEKAMGKMSEQESVEQGKGGKEGGGENSDGA
ncbi:hypothetical protein Slin14017_G086200 [Septoria linicola]|nr:hypothetical protein Slin14017_G086200 [Septoria linicola]